MEGRSAKCSLPSRQSPAGTDRREHPPCHTPHTRINPHSEHTLAMALPSNPTLSNASQGLAMRLRGRHDGQRRQRWELPRPPFEPPRPQLEIAGRAWAHTRPVPPVRIRARRRRPLPRLLPICGDRMLVDVPTGPLAIGRCPALPERKAAVDATARRRTPTHRRLRPWLQCSGRLREALGEDLHQCVVGVGRWQLAQEGLAGAHLSHARGRGGGRGGGRRGGKAGVTASSCGVVRWRAWCKPKWTGVTCQEMSRGTGRGPRPDTPLTTPYRHPFLLPVCSAREAAP